MFTPYIYLLYFFSHVFTSITTHSTRRVFFVLYCCCYYYYYYLPPPPSPPLPPCVTPWENLVIHVCTLPPNTPHLYTVCYLRQYGTISMHHLIIMLHRTAVSNYVYYELKSYHNNYFASLP